jgi:hypothetical protein
MAGGLAEDLFGPILPLDIIQGFIWPQKILLYSLEKEIPLLPGSG